MILRKYQNDIAIAAAELLKTCKIAYLSMQVRTGKTATALTAAELYGARNILFVTKKKAIASIEADHFALGNGTTLTCVNYESVHKYEGSPDLVILDEAHCLGQFPVAAERTKNLKLLCEGLPIIYLSGTPTPESYSQLYHQLWVSSFSPFREWTNFYKWAKAGFVNPKKIHIYNREFTDYSESVKTKIDDYTRHLFISYTQQQALFTEEVKEEIIYLRLPQKTYTLANTLMRDRVFIGKEGQEVIADTEVKLMQKLHQIYSGTVITEDGNAIVFDKSKADFIKEHFRGRKIAIFYKFKAEYTAIVATYGYDRLTESPEEFAVRDLKIFISQIQSGREGINLSTADAIVMYNIDFSSVSYQQVRARMQSKDRTKPALLYWIFAEDGIESKIYRAVKAKQDYTLSYFRGDFALSKTTQDVE